MAVEEEAVDEEKGEEEGDDSLARQRGSRRGKQQQHSAPRLLLLLLRLSKSTSVKRFPVMPSKESRERREQNRAVEAKLGEGETDGVRVDEEKGAEKLGKVYGDGGGREPDTSMM